MNDIMNDIEIPLLYKKYAKHILQYLSRHTSSKKDAEIILHEILLSYRKSKTKIEQNKCNEEACLFILTRNHLKNYYHSGQGAATSDAVETKTIPTAEESIEQALYLMDCREQVAEALQALDDRSRKVIVLRFFDKRTPMEIGQILGIDEGNVRVIQDHALKKLRSLMLEMEEELSRGIR